MLKKNLFYNAILSISNFLFPLITFPYSSRILGPSGIGGVVFIDSITAYFILVAALGIPLYAVRETAKRRYDQDALNKLASEILFIHIISVFVFAVIYLGAALLVPTLRPRIDLVLVGIASMFINVLSVEWFFQGIEKFRYIGMRSLFSKTISVVLLFTFLRKGSPLTIYYLITISGPALNSIFNIASFRKYCRLSFTNLSLRKHIKPLLTILGSSLASSVYLIMDTIILGFMKGDAAVGMYTTAMRIIKIPYAIIGSTSSVIIPQVSRAYNEGNKEAVNKLIDKSFSFVCVIGLPISVGMFLESGFLVDWFAGKNFEGSINVVKILSSEVLLIGLAHIFGLQILNAISKEKFVFRSVFTGMVFSLTVNLCLIPLFSYTGAAITNLFTEIVVTSSVFYYANKFVPISFDRKIFCKCLFAVGLFIPIALLIRTLNLNNTIKEVSIIVICGTTYFSFLWFFGNNVYIENLKDGILNKLSFVPGMKKLNNRFS